MTDPNQNAATAPEDQAGSSGSPTSGEGANAGAAAPAQPQGQQGDPTAGAASDKTLTQEEVNAIAAKAREEGRARLLKELGVEDAKAVKEALKRLEDSETSQLGEVEKERKLREKAEKAAAEANAHLLDLVKETVLREMGLDPALKDRLRGETRDEILADAEELAKVVAPKIPPSVGGPTAPATGNVGKTLEEELAEAQAAGDYKRTIQIKSRIASQVSS